MPHDSPDHHEYYAAQAALDEKYGVKQLRDDIAAAEEKKRALDVTLPATKSVDLGSLWGSKQCQAKSGVPFGGLGGDMREAVTKGLLTPRDITFVMVKTDNGWMIQQ